MIFWFLLQCLLTFIAFIVLIASGDYPGGDVGMTPLAVLLGVLIQFISSIAIYFSTRHLIKTEQHYIYIILSMILYELSFTIFSESVPFLNILNSGFEGYISRCYSGSSIISGVFMIIVFLFFRLRRTE